MRFETFMGPRPLAFALTVLSLGLLAACGAEEASEPINVEPAEWTAPPGEAQRAEPPRLFGPGASRASALTKVASALPGDSDLILSMAWDQKQLIDTFSVLPPGQTKQLTKDLQAILKRFTGIDGFDIREVVFFGSAERGPGYALLVGNFGRGALLGDKRRFGDLEAIAVSANSYAARLGGHLVFGAGSGMELASQVAAGKIESLSGSALLSAHTKIRRDLGAGSMVVSVVGKAADKHLSGAAGGPGSIRSVAAGFVPAKHALSVVVDGTDAARERLQAMAQKGLGMARVKAAQLSRESASADSMEAAMTAAVTAHTLRYYLDSTKFSEKGSSLRVDVALPPFLGSGQGDLMMLSALGVVAIPAFIKYMRRAKTTEAIDNLDKIYKGAALYYTTPLVDRRGNKLPCQFPASQGVTPVEATCCSTGGLGGPDADGDDRCDVDPDLWTTPTWSSLNFQISDQHYFTYSFLSSGTLSDAGFTATAHADLDCDSTQSTFQRMAFGDPQANMAECVLHHSAAFYVEKETE